MPCEEYGWNAAQTNLYGIPEQFKKKTKPVVIIYSYKMGHNLMRSAKKFHVSVVLSAANKLGELRVAVNKCSKEQPQCKKRNKSKFME